MNLSKSSSHSNIPVVGSADGRFIATDAGQSLPDRSRLRVGGAAASGQDVGGKHQTMNLSKNTFYAAAVATALFFGLSLPAQAEEYKNSNNFSDYEGNTIEIVDFGEYGPFRGSGTVIVNAKDSVRIDGTQIYYYALVARNADGTYVFASGQKMTSGDSGYAFVCTDDWDMTSLQVVESYLSSWSDGELIIENGDVALTGAISAWFDFGPTLNSKYGIENGGRMYGVQKITITGGSTLDVSYNRQSVNGVTGMVEDSDNIFVFLNNLNTGDDVSAGAETTLYIGYSSNYHIDIHIDGTTLANGGSIGQIIGSASVYKTGEGDFTFLTDNVDFKGDIYAAGGSLILNCSEEYQSSNDDPTGALARYGYDLEYGHALATASSVNIAGTVDETTLTNGSAVSSLSEASRAGVNVRFGVETANLTYEDDDGNTHYYTTVKNSFFPTAAAGTLVIEQNQIIKNFQAMFAVGAAATDSTKSAASAIRNAADSASPDSPLIPGTGAGSYLIIAEDATLAVYQEAGHGGIYKGTICGGVDENGNLTTGGTFVKYGAGDLALVLESADYKKLVVLEGTLVVNIEAINLDPGCYNWETEQWDVEPGVVAYTGLKIIQNGANTLDVRLVNSGVLEFSNYALIDTLGGDVDASNDFRRAGTVTVATEQRFVTGDVLISGGMKLILTATELYEGDINSWTTIDDEGNEVTESIEFSGGTFACANALIMWGLGEDGDYSDDVHAQLEFGNTNQKVNNLTGDLFSQIDLGRGTLTSNITLTGYETDYTDLQYGTFLGEISGIGNIVKTGEGTMTVGAGLAYHGVLAIAEGSYVATSSTGHDRYISALILNSGTTATLAGNQAMAALYGAKDATISVEGTLTVGNSASRAETLAQAAGSDGTLVTNNIANSSDYIKTYEINADTWLRSITDFVGKTKEFTYETVDVNEDPTTETVTVELLSEEQSAAISRYMNRSCTSSDWEILQEIFNRDDIAYTGNTADYTQITEGDFARLYVRLLAEDSFDALVCDDEGNVSLGTSYAEMVDRLSFDGSLTADTIEKIDSSKLTLSGSVKTNFIQIKEGTLELDYDALLPQQLEAVDPDDVEPLADTDGEGRVVVVEGYVADGIVIEDGATLCFNTTGAGDNAEITLDEEISGKGNFEKTGEGKLILGENVLYTGATTVVEGDLEMALRAEQGDVTVASDDATLTLVQTDDVTYSGAISDAGSLVKEGGGALTLDGDVAIGGDVDVEEGTLTFVNYVIAEDESTAGEQTIHIADGATFATDITERGERFAFTSYAEITGEGTFEKLGEGTLILAYSNDEEEAEKFTGTFVVNAGTLTLAAENIAPEASADVAADATLNIAADQELVEITGEGRVTIQSSATLTLSLEGNDDRLEIDSSSGMYETVTSEDDEHPFATFSGKISGGGTLLLSTKGVFALDASSIDNVGLSVSSGKLIIDSSLFYNPNAPLAVTIAGDGKASEVVLKVDGEEEITFYGSIETSDPTTTVNLGKYGAGILSITSDYTAGANLYVYQGTLKITGTDSKVFGFNSATVALDAVLEFSYSGDQIDLSNIEGSGTIKLCFDTSTAAGTRGIVLLNSGDMKSPVASSSSYGYFNGILEVDGIDLVVMAGSEGMDICSIASSEDASITVNGSGELTIYQEQDTVVAGTFNANNVTVTGSGRLAISSVDAVANFLVKNGNLQVDAKAKLVSNEDTEEGITGTIYVEGRSKLYFSSDSLGYDTKVDSISAAEIDLNGSITSLGIYKTGETDMEISFSGATDGGQAALSLSDELWSALAASSRTLSLGVEQGKLIISGLSDLDARVNIETLEGGTIVIKADTDAEILDRNITGGGDFEKTGSRSLTVTTTQGYTGTTTISNGSVSYESGVRLYTSELIIKSGASMSSGVTLVNGSFTLESGANAYLDITKGESISYFGDLTVEGTIYLTGSGAMTLGREMAIFNCTNPDAEWFTDDELRQLGARLDNNWSSLMISQTSAGTVSAYAIPESFSDISGVDLRDGLSGSFTRALDRLAGLDKIDENGVILASDVSEIGLALLTSSASALSETIANLSPISYSYMTAVVANTFRDDIEQISKRIIQRHYDATSDVVDNGLEYFLSARSNIVTNSHSNDSANYDYDTYGVFGGLDQKLDDVSLIGIAFSYDRGKADIHHDGGKIESDTFRVTLFGGTLFGPDYAFFFNAGASFHYGSYDVKRQTICGSATGDADGFGGGLFGEVGRGFLLYADSASGNRILFTARTGLSALYTRIGSFDEDGTAGLDTDAFDAFNLRWTIGGDLDYIFPVGEWSMRIGVSAGYAHEFVDDDVSIDSQFKAGGGKFSVDAVMFAENSIYAGPTFTVEVSEHTALFLGYYVEYGTNDFFDQNINLGFRHCF